MSDTPQTTSLIKLATIFQNEVIGTIRRTCTLAAMLPVVQGYNANGPNWVFRTSGALAQTHSEGSTFSDFGSDAQKTATLGWGLYEGGFDVTDEALSRARAAGNPKAVANLWALNMLAGVETLASKINNDVYTGTGSNSIIGLDTALDDDNTYAGVDRGTVTSFGSYVGGSGALQTLTTKQVRDDLANIKNKCDRRPNLAICNPLVFNVVAELFKAERQFVTVSGGGPQTAFFGESKVATVMVDGCTFVEDSDGYAASNSGKIYYLNTSTVGFEYIPYTTMMGFASQDVQTPLPFGVELLALPKTGHASKAILRCQVQLVVKDPRTCGIRQNISLV